MQGREADALTPIVAQLERRFTANIRASDSAHAREEARFYLQVTEDHSLALTRAEANWRQQREYEDAWLLIEAARAAGKPDAATPARRWMDDKTITAPALVKNMRRTKTN